MAKTLRQISSGGVVFREEKGRHEVALTARNKGTVWCLPKGLVEKGESLKETALREVKEETGLEGEIVTKIGDVKYWYSTKEDHELVRIFKVVHFFLMRYVRGSTEEHDWEVDEAKWFEIDNAIEMATYKSEKEMLRKAKRLLEQQ